MATKNKPVIGYRQCPDCGDRGTVHQAGGRRGSLYQRCGCGCDQRNGKLIQSRLFFETEFLDGLEPDLGDAIYSRDDYLAKTGIENAAPVDQLDHETQGLGADTVADVEAVNIDRETGQDSDQETSGKGALWLVGAGLLGTALFVMRAARGGA